MSFWMYPADRYYHPRYDEVPPEAADGQNKSAVVDQLRVNRHTRDDVRADVKQAVVKLGGTVRSSLAKRAAGDDVWDSPGVVDVSNQLVVSA